jgi:hypothetical protein
MITPPLGRSRRSSWQPAEGNGAEDRAEEDRGHQGCGESAAGDPRAAARAVPRPDRRQRSDRLRPLVAALVRQSSAEQAGLEANVHGQSVRGFLNGAVPHRATLDALEDWVRANRRELVRSGREQEWEHYVAECLGLDDEESERNTA